MNMGQQCHPPQWGQWNPNWKPSFRVIADGYKGYYTAEGKILTYFPLE